MRVLIVDDDRLIRRILSDGLRAEGVECAEAAGAREAIQAALSDPPDVCLLDLHLGDGDGFSVARLLLARPETAPVRFFLLTGSEEEGVRERALALGFSGILPKPVTPSQVLRKIRGR